jgi:hypothetical protein
LKQVSEMKKKYGHIKRVSTILWTMFSSWLFLSCFFRTHLTVLSYWVVYITIPMLTVFCISAAIEQSQMCGVLERISNILICVLCGIASLHALLRLFVPGDSVSTYMMPVASLDTVCNYLIPLSAVVIIKLVCKQKDALCKLHRIRLAADTTILGIMILTMLAVILWMDTAQWEITMYFPYQVARVFLVILFVVDTSLRYVDKNNKE